MENVLVCSEILESTFFFDALLIRCPSTLAIASWSHHVITRIFLCIYQTVAMGVSKVVAIL